MNKRYIYSPPNSRPWPQKFYFCLRPYWEISFLLWEGWADDLVLQPELPSLSVIIPLIIMVLLINTKLKFNIYGNDQHDQACKINIETNQCPFKQNLESWSRFNFVLYIFLINTYNYFDYDIYIAMILMLIY